MRLNARRGSEQYHSTKSSIAWSYVRCPLTDVSVFRTADLACSRSGSARTRFGALFLLRGFDLNDGLLGPPPPESTSRVRMVIEMDRVPPQPVKDPPNLIRTGVFSLDRLLSHIDPGTEEESEEFVRRIYEQRHIDLSSDRNGKTGR